VLRLEFDPLQLLLAQRPEHLNPDPMTSPNTRVLRLWSWRKWTSSSSPWIGRNHP
jgi:hypothetical protein